MYQIPDKKKDLFPAVIQWMVIKDLASQLGVDPKVIIKEKIKSLPSDILTKEDRKNRNRAFNRIFQKVPESDKCNFDLSEELKKALL